MFVSSFFFLSTEKKKNRTLNLYMRHKDENSYHNWAFHTVKESLTRMKADIWCYSKELQIMMRLYQFYL